MTRVAIVLLAFASTALGQSKRFTDVTEASGLDFIRDAGENGRYLLPEITGSGAAFLDYDNDGDLDVYFVQGPGKPNQLFRQEDGAHFTDVTEAAGVGHLGDGMGVAVGDVDNDSRVDLFVTNNGPNVLYRNLGSGRFRDATAEWGISGNQWSASAAFCDYDADGYLDLYVTHYVAFDPKKKCTQADGRDDYCSPQVFPGTPDTLYHNEGGRQFLDVSARAGLRSEKAPGLGVVCADWNGDGRLDFYVANDGEANQLWVNQGDGTFTDDAFLLGVALDGAGQPEAGMGIAVGDIEGDSDLDLLVTHVINQMNTLYVAGGALGFDDRTTASGLGAASLSFTGFGVGFFDFDHDSDLDVAVANGRILRRPPLPGATSSPYWNGYAEPNQLLENDGKGKFRDVSAASGDFGDGVEVSRGLAFGDYDSDGDLDLLVTNTGAKARLYRNDASKTGDWLLVRAFEPKANRDACGARVTAVAGGKRYLRLANPGYSYLVSNDPRAHFGLPKGAKVEALEIEWPDGTKEKFPGVETNQAVTVSKGSGSRK